MIRTVWLAPALALIAACSAEKKEEPAKAAALPTLHEMMVQKIDVDADAVWAIGNAAINDKALIDPAKMTDATWKELDQASQRLSGHAKELGALDPVIVTRPGVPVADEGTPGAPSPAEIQAHIKRDTDLFRSLAGSLEQHATDLATAARAKNAEKAGGLINEMDGVCEACHLEFWYPEQKAMVEAIMAKANADAPKNSPQ
jgi:hypothetical protein